VVLGWEQAVAGTKLVCSQIGDGQMRRTMMRLGSKVENQMRMRCDLRMLSMCGFLERTFLVCKKHQVRSLGWKVGKRAMMRCDLRM